jgi:hypothetical protein
MEDIGKFNDHLVHHTAIWYILLPFDVGIVVIWYIFHVLVCCTMKNLEKPLPNPINQFK